MGPGQHRNAQFPFNPGGSCLSQRLRRANRTRVRGRHAGQQDYLAALGARFPFHTREVGLGQPQDARGIDIASDRKVSATGKLLFTDRQVGQRVTQPRSLHYKDPRA